MNCLLYARVSTDKQAQKDLSIPAQIEAMKDFARKNSWKIEKVFIDEGESAKTANRPELKRLIQHCKENKCVDVVVVHKIDRLARNLVDYATIKAILKQKGIRLVSVSEPFDDNPVGQLLENIIASISEWYSANLGQEIKKSNSEKLRRGEWPHKPPLGYKSAKGESNRVQHVPDETTAPLVRQAFELFATGNYSLKTLSEEMADRGLTTRYNKMYSPECMKMLLMRKFYLGKLVWNGKEYKGKHEPIVTADLFWRVQDTLKQRGVDTGEKGKLKFLLRGIAYCAVCGQRLTGEIHPRGSYYRCLPNIHKQKCSQPYIPVASLESQLEALYAKFQPPKNLLEALKLEVQGIADKRKRIAQREIKQLRQTVGDLENKEMKLLDEKLSGKVPSEVYEKLEQKYREKREQAEARLSQFEVDYDDPLDFLDKSILVASMLLHLHGKFDFDRKKMLLKAVFEKIYVKNRAIVGVKLNPPFSYLLKDDIDNVFKDPPAGRTKQDILEQLIHFMITDRSAEVRCTVDTIVNATDRNLKI